jgi:AraC-like DNA-binding protein
LASEAIIGKNDIPDDLVSEKLIEKGLGILRVRNQKSESAEFEMNLPKHVILFLFPFEGKVSLQSEVQNTKEELKSVSYGVIAYPFDNWSIKLSLGKNTTIGFLLVSLQKVHELFELDINDKIDPSVIARNYRMKSFLSSRSKSPAITVTLKQLFEPQITTNYSRIYEKAKVLELLTLYMEQGMRPSDTKSACPVIHENLEVEKIRRVEKILVHNMATPPSIPELAKIVGTNEMKLKNGFKELFGNTIYGYLMDYRMDSARVMLDNGGVQIKDVAYSVGYSNPSHFIAAFKKKFGVTPKRYLQRH